jgi:hypothetical protein
VEEIKVVNNNIDSLMVLADAAIINLKEKKKQSQLVQNKLNQKVLDIIYVRNHFKDSIDELRNLRLIDRDSVIYNYNIELITIVDTVRVSISDSICSVCIDKIEKRKRKSIFNIFKKNKKDEYTE